MLTKASGPISVSGWIITALAVVITGIFVYQDLTLKNTRKEVSDNKSALLFEQMHGKLKEKDKQLETAEEANVRLQGSIDLRNEIDEAAREVTQLQKLNVEKIVTKKDAIKAKLPTIKEGVTEPSEESKRHLARITAIWDAYCLTPEPKCMECCS